MNGLLLDPHSALAEEITLGALLRCCIRELCGPRVRTAGPYLLASIAGTRVRVPARGGMSLRFTGRAERLAGGVWEPLTSDTLIKLVERQLAGGGEGPGGGFNGEFAAQVTASREAVAALLAARERATPPADPWLASEQALVGGHPFHPSPKMGIGPGSERYAPEAHARFPLRLLGVRADLVAGQGDTSVLDSMGAFPPGYLPLPAHPWQLELLAPDLREPLADGRLVDLGYGSRPVFPTSSVRTVYEPVAGVCLKFSLDVRITNCVRKNAWYELAGAVELTRRLGPVFDRLAERFPGTRWLPEPGYRSAALGTRLLEGLGVIVRSGPWPVCEPGVTPILAAALAASPYGTADVRDTGVPEAAEARRRTDPVTWWRAYVERVALPALDAFVRHGVVLEPHLQNVLVGVDADGLPAQAIFRDLEGAKLIEGRHDLSGLPERVAEALTYASDRGWNRVAYCLVVNHLAEIAATVAEAADPEEERQVPRELWAAAGKVLSGHAEDRGWPAPLRALLSDATLPAKANLGVRWRRHADRAAGYVPVANPLSSMRPDL
ncbi:IucA/IucC family protein [Sphaerimonospora sp. CA-214678]|uniref:IucA/IucC family protein n=1 Tax=Sphaerimonospora sp. CA-214678 TaxID=3240029 RepID=UPI003D8CBB06